MEIPLLYLAVVGLTIGILSHVGYFMRGEHHRLAYQFFLAAVTFPVLSVASLVFLQTPILQSVKLTATFYYSYMTGLYGSIFVYRGFLHRLHSFPGPFWAKIWRLWFVSQVAARLDNFKVLDRLHQEYGTYVRVGPNDVSIIHPDVVEAVYGAASKCTKGPGYEGSNELTSMHSTRNRKDHDRRRRAWARGFTANSLREYEPRVDQYTQSLIDQLKAFSGKPVNAAEWFNYYSFDVMGDLAFAKSFDMLKNGQSHWAIKLLNNGQRGIGIFGSVPWLFGILSKIPGLTKGFHKFIKFCDDMMDNREKMEVDRPDISTWILQSPEMEDSRYTQRAWLTGDSRLIIVAGSDTTAATLTHLFYHLSKEPVHMKALREEIDSLNGDLSAPALLPLKYLNGAINESLRLHPPVPGGVQRLSPPEGITIGDRYIPGEVAIYVPMYTLFRSPEAYEYPNEFLPERWSSKPELTKRPDAFCPFLIGPYGCIGKQLALMEIRSVTAQVLLNFDVSFAPGEDGTNLVENTKDCFTMELAGLNLCFTPRDSVSKS